MSKGKTEQHENGTMTKDELLADMAEERISRERACKAGIDAVLKEYNCSLMPQISADGHIATASIVIAARN